MIGWIADGFRATWALIYWNLRKGIFRLRGAEGRCPCQNPSDSGRAWETRCDACFGWRQPARFRRVCPLLQTAPDGTLKCSVDAAQVRPFWGRFLGYYATGTATAWLLAALLAFSVMRLIGYPVSLPAVAWPPAWSQINQARSSYFLQRAEDAYAAERINEAVMSLSLAYEYDPDNYAAGLLLARIWEANQVESSNQLYERLLAEHAERRADTAQHWLRALLPRGDFSMIERLAAAAMQFDHANLTAWMHAFLFTNERTGNLQLIEDLQQPMAGLPVGVRRVLQLESACRTTPPQEMRALLAEPPAADLPSFVAYYQARRLASLGFPAEALDLIAREASGLSAHDRAELSLLAYRAAGHRRLYVTAFDHIVQGPPTTNMIELVCAHLIRHPDEELYRRFIARVDPLGLPATAERRSTATTLLCLALIHGDEERAGSLSGLIRTSTRGSGSALSRAEAFFRQSAGRLPDFLPGLQPLALEVNYALLARFEPAPPPSRFRFSSE